jgi:hypothetical protein
MSLTTFSGFTYGHDISEDNQFIDFNEDGSTEIGAQIKIGSYTLQTFIDAVSNAMNEAGENTYTVTVDRATRLITITGSAPFNLTVLSGSHFEISAFALMGFTTNRSGSNTYTGNQPSGFFYEPQYKLQKYVDFDDIVESVDSSVNTSASGIVEVVSFGQNQFMECNITYVTNIVGQGVIKNNPSGVSDLRAFMNYAIQKKPMEFIPDLLTPGVYVPCILEKTQKNSKGVGFQLYELYSKGLANYFETGTLTFRKV